MKHVFLIHSHTVFLTTMGVINKLNLNSENVVFIYFRNYTNSLIPINYKVIRMDDEYTQMNKLSAIKFKENRVFINKIDEIVEEKIADNFIVYGSHAGSHFIQTFITNKKCVQFNYIQEGALAFGTLCSYKKNLKSIFYDIVNLFVFPINEKRIWCNYRWIVRMDVIKGKTTPKCYAISENIFKSLPFETTIVQWPKFNPNIDLNVSFPFFIMEASIEHHMVEKENYFSCLEEMIKENAIENNYIKFHPFQSKEHRAEIIALFEKNNCHVKELPDSVPFELILSYYKDLLILGFRSSLLVYAKQLGHRVISKENDLRKLSIKYNNVRKLMNEIDEN